MKSVFDRMRDWWWLVIVGAMLVGCLWLSSLADAADWRSAAQQCAAQIEELHGCRTACVNETWPEVARCANEKLTRRFPQDKLETCIQGVKKARDAAQPCEQCGDPVKSAFDCAGG